MAQDEIYSPESSDNQRFGDWQSRLVFWLVWVPVLAISAWGLVSLMQRAHG